MEAKGQSKEAIGSQQISEEQVSLLSPHRESLDSSEQMIQRLIHERRPIFVVSRCRESPENQQLQQEIIKQKILSYNRKEKSLEELSRKFIENFEGREEVTLELDKVTLQLKVERRRIYDIVNIFESLQVVRKASKNNYVWRGLKQALKTITTILHFPESSFPLSNKKEKSLENLAARFLKLFVSAECSIGLEEAARALIQSEDSALVKTKIRRLYDIVNVFKSVGLVQKDHLPNKKPGFRWLGTHRLQKIIEERRTKCQGVKEEALHGSPYKQNERALENTTNVNDWFSLEERRVFVGLGFMKEFSQKLFFPSIIQREQSTSTFGGSQQCLNDICAQY